MTVSLLIALGLLAYTGSRAYLMAFTIDESLTFVYHVRATLADILLFRVGTAPSNNHILNTLLMKLVAKFLGNSEFLLRLPNLVAHAVYLCSSLLIVKHIHQGWTIVPTFILLNANPFLLDWFSLARGYGLALALMMASAYYGMIAFSRKEFSLRRLYLASALGAASVSASLPFLDYYVAFLLIGGILLVWRTSKNVSSTRPITFGRTISLGWLGPFALGSAAIAIFVLGPIATLFKLKEFYYGGTAGFWPDTVGTLLRASLYDRPDAGKWLSPLSICVIVLTVLLAASTLHAFFSSGIAALTDAGPYFVSVTACTVAVALAQHYVLGTKFLIDRTAIMFVPLFLLSLVSWKGSLVLSMLGRLPMTYLRGSFLFIGALLALANLASSLTWSNPLYTSEDASTKKVMVDLSRDYQTRHPVGETVTFVVPMFREYSANYYRLTMHLDWLEPVVTVQEADPCACNYRLIHTKSLDNSSNRQDHPQFIVNTYPETGFTLAVETR